MGSGHNKVEYKVCFECQENYYEISCSPNEKMMNICKPIADKLQVKMDSLSFQYNNKNIDLTKSLYEIANPDDLKKREIKISVNNKTEINDFVPHDFQYVSDGNKTHIPLQYAQNPSNMKQSENEDKPCCERHKNKIIGLILGLIILGVIIFLILYFTLIKDKKDDNKKKCVLGDGENCAECDNILGGCKQCNKGYELFEQSCHLYSISATYNIKNSLENINLINPESIKNIYFMNINNTNQNPTSVFSFTNSGNQKIYLFLKKNLKFPYQICLKIF